MDRNALRDRLIKAEFPEEIVDSFLTTVKDEDLVRLKDMNSDELLKAFKDALAEMDEEEEQGDDTDDTSDDSTTTKDDADDSVDTLASVLSALGDGIVAQIKDTFKEMSVEVEVPQMNQILENIQTLKDTMAETSQALKEMQEALGEILKTDTSRLKDMLGNMSPKARERLRLTLSDDETRGNQRTKDAPKGNVFRPGIDTNFQPVIQDVDGNMYGTLADMAWGRSSEE